MIREDVQKKAVDLSGKYDYLLLEFATGVGKTLAAIKCLAAHCQGRFLWLVPQTPLIANAQRDFILHGYEDLLQKGDFACYQSLAKFEGMTYGMTIKDESHSGTSDLRIEGLQKITSQKIIALSATVSQEVWDKLNLLGNFYRYTVTLNQAIEWGILAEPVINVVSIDLDTKTLRNKVKGKMLSDRDYYDYLCDSIDFWRAKNNDFKMKTLGGERQRFLGKCKTELAKSIIKTFDNERFICFTSSVEQAKLLGGKQAVSSQRTAKQNKEIIDDFNAGGANALFCKNLLTEGVNLVNTKYGLIIQLGNKERFAIQAIGRTLRHDYPEVYILHVNNTVDDRFLKNSLSNINPKYVNYAKEDN